MNNAEYYYKRNYADLENCKTIEELTQSISKLYTNVSIDVVKETNAFFNKYNINSYSDLNIRLTKDELKYFKSECRRYYEMLKEIRIACEDKTTKHILMNFSKELRLLSSRTNISRISNIKENLKNIIVKLGCDEQSLFANTFSKTINASYFSSSLKLNKLLDKVSNVDTRLIQKLLETKWLGDNYSSRIWKNKQLLVEKLETILIKGIATGKTSEEIAKELSIALNANYKNCLRLVKTETAHIINATNLDVYKENGIKKYKYISSMSERMCEECGSLDGMIFRIQDAQEGINYPVMHPNCMCTTEPIISSTS